MLTSSLSSNWPLYILILLCSEVIQHQRSSIIYDFGNPFFEGVKFVCWNNIFDQKRTIETIIIPNLMGFSGYFSTRG